MRFSSVLGTFALSILEGYRAYAGLFKAISPETQSLKGRDGETCCVIVDKRGYSVTYTGEYKVLVTIQGQCKVFVDQIGSPSSGDCDTWSVIREGCPGPNDPDVQVVPTDFCS
ncbi:hypothetical protein E4U33_004231 [Claviceps sp. LM78 group G4]|nr:hypothetical protein E4U33_004231 [Claviceps sp. LM78 group G4]